jgi:hypothetical protein
LQSLMHRSVWLHCISVWVAVMWMWGVGVCAARLSALMSYMFVSSHQLAVLSVFLANSLALGVG